MIIPVRCFTCGAVVASGYEVYKAALADGKNGEQALEAAGLERFCCRRMLVSQRDLLAEAALYE